MNYRRSALSWSACCRPIWLLVAVLAFGGQIGLGSRAADRLGSLLAGIDPGSSAPLCGRGSRGPHAAEAPVDTPPVPHLVCVLPAVGDAPDLLAPVRIAVSPPGRATAQADVLRLAGEAVPEADGGLPYPRGPPDRG